MDLLFSEGPITNYVEGQREQNVNVTLLQRKLLNKIFIVRGRRGGVKINPKNPVNVVNVLQYHTGILRAFLSFISERILEQIQVNF